ncbi:MAG: hypothetical protein HQK52_19480 [Oligoflexia bacterium]|nr:hypothetical protein [Oligoflexia bacterium]
MRLDVYISPINANGKYDSEVDITNHVLDKTNFKVIKSLEGQDFSIGSNTVDDIDIVCDNSQGLFSDNYYKSIFKYKRDLSRVRVSLDSKDIFLGVLAEESSRQNILHNIVKFKILSIDHVLNKLLFDQNSVTPGDSVLHALKKIFTSHKTNTKEVLFEIDDNAIIDGARYKRPYRLKEIVDGLSLLCNFWYLKKDFGYVFKSKNVKQDNARDLSKHVVDITNFNSGLHRVLNSLVINGIPSEQTPQTASSINSFGLKGKVIEAPFFQNEENIKHLSAEVLKLYCAPKKEMQAKVPIDTGIDMELLDPVSIDIDRLYLNNKNGIVPYVGTFLVGDPYMKIPASSNDLRLECSDYYVIEIEHDINQLITTMKLREI